VFEGSRLPDLPQDVVVRRVRANPDPARRFVVTALCGATVSVSAGLLALVAAPASTPLPREVAGIRLPDSPLALAAADLARTASPAFLFNHCMRTFLFGALLAERDRVAYDQEMIFIAAGLHDLGLTTTYASAAQPFEVDGADAAKAFLVSRGVSEPRAELVWNAIALHTSVLVEHQPPQVGLVADGAGADVFGSELDTLPTEHVRAVVGAFPRLSFNTEFRDLLVAHCHRKPFAQRGTWLDGFCRLHNPAVRYPDLESRILSTRVGD
jgi:HD domain